MNELITTKTSLSPRREWQDRHEILSYACEGEHIAHVDGDETIGKGYDHEDALLDWAVQKEIPCWREEQFLKRGGNDE